MPLGGSPSSPPKWGAEAIESGVPLSPAEWRPGGWHPATPGALPVAPDLSTSTYHPLPCTPASQVDTPCVLSSLHPVPLGRHFFRGSDGLPGRKRNTGMDTPHADSLQRSEGPCEMHALHTQRACSTTGLFPMRSCVSSHHISAILLLNKR